MKEAHNLFSPGIDSSQVRTFVEVAAVACQREIIRIIGAAMLFRHNVLNMVNEFAVLLVRPAVLAMLAGPPPH